MATLTTTYESASGETATPRDDGGWLDPALKLPGVVSDHEASGTLAAGQSQTLVFVYDMPRARGFFSYSTPMRADYTWVFDSAIAACNQSTAAPGESSAICSSKVLNAVIAVDANLKDPIVPSPSINDAEIQALGHKYNLDAREFKAFVGALSAVGPGRYGLDWQGYTASEIRGMISQVVTQACAGTGD